MEYWFHQQVKYTVTGFLLMILVCRIDYSVLCKWSRQIAGGILLFILLSLVTGVQVYGRIYGLRVGPVMIPTFGMIWLYVPAYAAVLYTYRGRSYKGLTGLLIWTLLPIFLVLRLPGLNQAVMLLFICLLLFSIAIPPTTPVNQSVYPDFTIIWCYVCFYDCFCSIHFCLCNVYELPAR